MKIRILLLTLICFSTSFAQQRNCGTEQYMQQKLSNPVFAAQHQERQSAFNVEMNKVSSENRAPQAMIVIPVAVHFTTGNNANRACLVALAQNQIDILNNDYNATNADMSNWAAAASFYSGVVPGNTQVQFCIATLNHPANTDPNLVSGQPAVTIGYNFGGGNDSDIKWKGYLNFIIKDAGNGILGYSPLGGDFDAGEGVVLGFDYFGSGAGCSGFVPTAPYDLGRTVTHELGHFFNLDHTFGHGNGCNGSNTDSVSDTPKVGAETYGKPNPGTVAGCTSPQKALTMSYMDYTDDDHMYMFSAGQTTRAKAYMVSQQNKFKTGVTACAPLLAVADNEMKQFSSIYPNPNKGSFTVEFNSNSNNVINIMVHDLTGRKVFENKYTPSVALFSQNIQLANAQSGIYLLTVKDGERTEVKRVVVE
jgi:hypothetical protein